MNTKIYALIIFMIKELYASPNLVFEGLKNPSS